jgi:alanyl-tRNA synthetase
MTSKRLPFTASPYVFRNAGNFSFGDYFKADAIPMAWELLTKVFEIPVERMWFTVFQGNERVPADEDAVALWIKAGADPSRVLRFGDKDNFWVTADTCPGCPVLRNHRLSLVMTSAKCRLLV